MTASAPIAESSYVLEVASNPTPPESERPQWQSIFNSAAFFKLHADDRPGYYFQFLNSATRETVAVAHFAETSPGVFVSPTRGTFGGYEAEAHDLRMLEGFVSAVDAFLSEAAAQSVSITLKPFAHDPAETSTLCNLLARLGYRANVYDLSYVLPIMPGGLIERMQRNNQKRLRKCEREGFVFTPCTTHDACSAAYDAIVTNRTAKGIPVTMSLDQLMLMRQTFPGAVHFFDVRRAGTVVAGSVCIAVNPRVFYVFYWGDAPGYETFSPVVLLASGIHEFARERGFSLLDAGISTVQGIPNHGLIRFKEALGFEPSLKVGFTKDFGRA